MYVHTYRTASFSSSFGWLWLSVSKMQHRTSVASCLLLACVSPWKSRSPHGMGEGPHHIRTGPARSWLEDSHGKAMLFRAGSLLTPPVDAILGRRSLLSWQIQGELLQVKLQKAKTAPNSKQAYPAPSFSCAWAPPEQGLVSQVADMVRGQTPISQMKRTGAVGKSKVSAVAAQQCSSAAALQSHHRPRWKSRRRPTVISSQQACSCMKRCLASHTQ